MWTHYVQSSQTKIADMIISSQIKGKQLQKHILLNDILAMSCKLNYQILDTTSEERIQQLQMKQQHNLELL